jgi:anthranilate phosphoribosyltransferase
VLLNAGAGLYIGGKAGTHAEGVALAAKLIDSGAAMRKLEEFIEESNKPEAQP